MVVFDATAEALRRASESPGDVAVVLAERLPESRDFPWAGRVVLAFGDETATLTVRLPRMVLELDGTPPEAWDELDAATPEDWERAVVHRLGDLPADIEVPPDAGWTYAETAHRQRSAIRFAEVRHYDSAGLALDMWRLPRVTSSANS